MVSSGRNGTKEWVRAAQAAPPQPLLSVFMLHDLAPTAVVGQMAGWPHPAVRLAGLHYAKAATPMCTIR